MPPVGLQLTNGFKTTITFAADSDVSFWEESITPPGIDGGDPLPTTTQFNNAWNTTDPRSLKTLTDVSVTAAYDPIVYDQIIALVNVSNLITIAFPDGSSLDFHGFLRSFTPGELVAGTPPTAAIVIAPTAVDIATGLETAPVYTPAP